MRLFPILPVLCALLSGCASSAGPAAHAGESYIVKASRTQFYSFGPAQPTGPDFALPRGQRIIMLGYQYGYSYVAIAGAGQSGYVATGDIAPAAPTPPVPPAAPGSRRRAPAAHSSAVPTRIPLPEFPESEPPPGTPPFRY